MCRNGLSLLKFSYPLTDNFNILSFCCIFVSRLITSIETRNVRFFTFVFLVKGMISVILILVLAVYQQILSSTEQGFVHCYEKTEHPCFNEGLGHAISNLALGVGQSFLCRREGLGHVFIINHISKCSGPPTPPPPILFDQSLISLFEQRATLLYCSGEELIRES